jgi:hypothetical protein
MARGFAPRAETLREVTRMAHFSWYYEHNTIPEDAVKVYVVEVDMHPKSAGEREETLVALLPPDWAYYNKLFVCISFPNGNEVRIYNDGAVLLFRSGAKEGEYLYRPNL